MQNIHYTFCESFDITNELHNEGFMTRIYHVNVEVENEKAPQLFKKVAERTCNGKFEELKFAMRIGGRIHTEIRVTTYPIEMRTINERAEISAARSRISKRWC